MKKYTCLVVLVCLALTIAPCASAQQFGPWSAPVSLGPAINTTQYFEQGAAISKDGLSLYFHSNRPGGLGGADIYVSQRSSVDAPWGAPKNLGPTINSSKGDASPFLSHDGHRLYFHSGRPGGCGGSDLYVSRRHNKRDDFGWQLPVNLGCLVNSPASDVQPWIFEDDTTGTTTLYFVSDRPGGFGGSDLYASELQPDETFGPAVNVAELNSPANDGGVTVRRDGLEIIFASNRAGSFGDLGDDDLWVSTRLSTSDPWSPPENLGSVINTVYTDGLPELSFDGTTLYLNSADPTLTSFDLFVAVRTKLKE